MGYYIDFVFDPEIPVTRGIVIEKLKRAGAVEFVDETRPGHGYDNMFNYPDLFGVITVYAKENRRYLKGNWADIRTSWGNTPEDIRSVWEAAFEIAEKIGCWVYDGQLKSYVFPEDLERLVGSFCRSASSIAKLFGTVATDIENANSQGF